MTDFNAMSDFEINKRVAEIQFQNATAIKEPVYGYPTEIFKKGEEARRAWRDLDKSLNPDKYRESIVLVLHHDLAKHFDPCNKPADAWPIIFENHVCIVSTDVKSTQWCAYNWDDCDDECWHENPLRAAMVCYLMMMEGE